MDAVLQLELHLRRFSPRSLMMYQIFPLLLAAFWHYQSECPWSSPLTHIWDIILSSASTLTFFLFPFWFCSPILRTFYFLLPSFQILLLAQLLLLPNNSQLFRSKLHFWNLFWIVWLPPGELHIWLWGMVLSLSSILPTPKWTHEDFFPLNKCILLLFFPFTFMIKLSIFSKLMHMNQIYSY